MAPVVAAAAAALVETIPVRLDDNISVPAAAASVLWGGSLVTGDAWWSAWPGMADAFAPALVVNVLMAGLAWRLRTVSLSGAIDGALLGFVVFACSGFAGWLLLFATFVIASLTSRLGFRRKVLLGIAEERGGRRAAGNALANCGVAAAAAILATASPYQQTALLAMVAALTAAGSDTVASEIGKAWGRHTFLVTSFTRAQPGTPGGISFEGTAAGLVGALALAALAQAGSLIPSAFIWMVVVGATCGSVVESALGATLEAPGILNNDLLNFINTAVAAVCAVMLAGLAS